MRRAKNHPLGPEVLRVLERHGAMAAAQIARILGETTQSVSVACIHLARDCQARSFKTGRRYVQNGQQREELFWELGVPQTPVLRPNRSREHHAVSIGIGITDEDLAWMRHYRARRLERLAQQGETDAAQE